MLLRLGYALVAVALLVLGAADVFLCITGFGFIKEGLLHNRPLYLDFFTSREYRVAGRFGAIVMLMLPLLHSGLRSSWGVTRGAKTGRNVFELHHPINPDNFSSSRGTRRSPTPKRFRHSATFCIR